MFENRTNGSSVRALVCFGLFLIPAALLVGCEEKNVARVYGPSSNPGMTGQWKGTVTALLISGGDTLQTVTSRTRYTFTDSTFTYRLLDDYNATIKPYIGGGLCQRNDDRVYFTDTTTYGEYVDRTLTPISNERYTVTLSSTTMTLLWLHDYGNGIVRNQRIHLVRS